MEVIAKQVSKNVHEYRIVCQHKDEFYVGHLSDIHYDSAKCDRELLAKHLKFLEEKNALVVINGDLYDAMQGKGDRRGDKSSLRPEYKTSAYFDAIVDDTVDFLSKFNVRYHLNTGNHESAGTQHHEIDLLRATKDRLLAKGVKVETGAYSGYIVMRYCSQGKTRYEVTRTQTTWYHHGYGGSAERSKGVLSADIDTMQNPSADIIVKGHDHNSFYLPLTVKELNQAMQIVNKTVHHIRTGSYKKPNIEGMGWEVEKGFGMKTMGGWCVKTTYDRSDLQLGVNVFKL